MHGAIRLGNAFNQELTVLHEVYFQEIDRELGNLIDKVIRMSTRFDYAMNPVFSEEQRETFSPLIVDFIQVGNDFDRLVANAFIRPKSITSNS